MAVVRFLRTASTGRLLAVIAAALIGIAAGAAIAVAATGGGGVPPRSSLAGAVHRAIAAGARHPVTGVTADVAFTNNLIDSSDFTGQAADPLLQGASGRLWAGDARLRIELQSDDGDVEIVVNHRSFWISDPAENVVYEGSLPAGHAGSSGSSAGGSIPPVARLRTVIAGLMRRVDLSGAEPTDVGGRPAYRVAVSPRTGGGLLGSVKLAWDAATGVPLQIAVDARGSSTPVLALTATHVSYGVVPDSDFAVSPPAGAKVVRLGTLGGGRGPGARAGNGAGSRRRPAVSGVGAVAARLGFALHAPAALAGRPRERVRLLGAGSTSSALLVYGRGPGSIAVLESRHAGGSASPAGGSLDGLSLPTRSINGATATVLSTQLGTVLHFTHGGVAYTVLGSVPAATAEQAARGL
jgi:hypothetical protein